MVMGRGLLAGLLLRQASGGDAPPPRVPPHLCNRRWRFLCECGYGWRATLDAVVRDGRVAEPRQACTSCHQWVTGRIDSDT
jgi:hypothetical protein